MNKKSFTLIFACLLSATLSAMEDKQSNSAEYFSVAKQNQDSNQINPANTQLKIAFEGPTKTISNARTVLSFPRSKTELAAIISLYTQAREKNESALPSIDSIKNNYAQTILIVAAMIGDYNTIDALLKCGAQVDTKDPLNRTALNWAASSGVLTPNLSFISDEEKTKAFTLCSEKLIDAGADLNNCCYEEKNGIRTKNMAPIHSACVAGNKQLVELILNKAKAKNILQDIVAARGHNNRNALHFTTRFCEGAVQKELSQHDASTMEAIARILIENGCSRDSVDTFGKTPFSYADDCKMPNTLCNLLFSYSYLDNTRKTHNKPAKHTYNKK